MYLNGLKVNGFRCFGEQFEIVFSKGLNVVVGENGAGKTAIISAIRQLFQDSESGRYSVSSDDFYCAFNPDAEPASFFLFLLTLQILVTKTKFLSCIGQGELMLLN